jgi:flagellar M-ring protein FliF
MTETATTSAWRESLAALDRGGRIALGVAAAVAVAALIGVAVWLMRTEYQVLFSQLSETDAGAIVERLKQSKEPYRITQGGSAIEVPADRVHETRLALMSSGTPLAGGVGFEIFDRQGLGATEQSQRVSYQRALQGELARTISALDGVRQARVHLVMPESSLFRRDRQDPRAAVTLEVEPAAGIGREHVAGIQRLVAASVAGLSPERVVVADQRGVTLSATDAFIDIGAAGGVGGSGLGETRLVMKRQVEDYLTRKIVDLFDRTFGPGRAIVTVDATLNFDQVRRTVQDLAPLTDRSGAVVQRRQVRASDGTEAEPLTFDTGARAPGRSSSTDEVTFEYGRRVEQVVAAPGGLSRLSVGVVVPGTLDPERRSRILALVRAAAGIDPARGDTVVVESLSSTVEAASPVVGAPIEGTAALAAAGEGGVADAAPTASVPARAAAAGPGWSLRWFDAVLLAALAAAIVLAAAAWRSRSAAARAAPSAGREQLLADLERALGPAAQPGTEGVSPRPGR